VTGPTRLSPQPIAGAWLAGQKPAKVAPRQATAAEKTRLATLHGATFAQAQAFITGLGDTRVLANDYDFINGLSDAATAAAAKHLKAHGVGFELLSQDGMRLLPGPSRLGAFAAAWERQGVEVVYMPGELAIAHAAGQADADKIIIGGREIESLTPATTTAPHESMHVHFKAMQRAKKASPYFGCATVIAEGILPGPTQGGYGTHMSFEELATHARDMRQLVRAIGRGERVNVETGEDHVERLQVKICRSIELALRAQAITEQASAHVRNGGQVSYVQATRAVEATLTLAGGYRLRVPLVDSGGAGQADANRELLREQLTWTKATASAHLALARIASQAYDDVASSEPRTSRIAACALADVLSRHSDADYNELF
jgi:hypothetical protein